MILEYINFNRNGSGRISCLWSAVKVLVVITIGGSMNLPVFAEMDADWVAESERRIEALRKGDFVFSLPENNITPDDDGVNVRLVRHHFMFGMCLGGNPESDNTDERRYFDFVRRNFNAVVMENAAKWYATEKEPGLLSYKSADRLERWARDNNLAMRGHCLLWSVPKYVQDWVKALDKDDLRSAVEHRLTDVLTRYRGRFCAWDVNNEMLDGSFYAERLGAEIRPWIFIRAHALDPDTPLFVNEYSILGNMQKTGRYLDLIQELRAAGAPLGGIGIQEHACERMVRGMRPEDDERPERKEWHHIHPVQAWKSLDALAETGLPIHLTEISARTPDQLERADAIETILRTGFAHPAVELILLWGFWEKRHWLGEDAALVDADFKPLPAGERYLELVNKVWSTSIDALQPDAAGNISFRGFYGTYEISGTDPDGQAWTRSVTFAP